MLTTETAPVGAADETLDRWLADQGLDGDMSADRVERDRWTIRRLKALRKLREDMAHNQAVRDAEVREHDEWLEAVNAPLARQEARLVGILEMDARARYAEGAKATKLPGGKIGGRASAETVAIVDHAAALEFARRTDGLAEEIKVTERINLTPLKHYMQSTGEVPDGCEVVPATVRYYVETTGGEE